MFDYISPFLFLSSGVIVNKLILKVWSPGLLVGIRMLLSGLILGSIALYKGRKNFWDRFRKRWFYLAFLASFAAFIPGLLKAYALKHTYASKVALIGSLDPFITALYAYLLWHEKLTRNKWIGILVGFIGIILLIISHSASDMHEIFGPISLAELAAFGAACVSRFGWIKIQQLLQAHIFNVKEINSICMTFAGIYSLISTAWIMPQAFSAPWSLNIIMYLLYTIIGGNLIGYTLYSHLLKKHSATFVSLAGFSMPLFVYFFGWLILGERLYPSFILSALVTFVGLLIFYRDEIKKAVAKEKK
ncbi:TPA: hypothetical protein DIC20_00710 [Candidatus Dependentiae bacterium]|nr:MAG: hypothetical protein US03_C0002G0010 [candidate division TM6 bacterium GW2011_GWF2_36_131]KKQ03444.1 MAG: hypothetical protein US13_C0002G0010 [candidate division TM6 bacterium GW2011_GWE2_36_25]KKQ20282.1 MAG: hypothetical protein US32_C0001G0179 [candidate division TM6 bacterium GW2011_GWA2_36_9]HBR70822.1 hypothetical protein [Candidatus Dependentiae bacterium]HCU00207.1 hypothetical protein [Candidatus Dependentiae bacterium]